MGESHVCITVSTTSACALSGDVSKWRDFVANNFFAALPRLFVWVGDAEGRLTNETIRTKK